MTLQTRESLANDISGGGGGPHAWLDHPGAHGTDEKQRRRLLSPFPDQVRRATAGTALADLTAESTNERGSDDRVQVDEVTRERAQSFLERDHIARIVAAYQTFEDAPGFARVATRDEIRANRANLSIPLYVSSLAAGTGPGDKSLAKGIAEWEASSRALRDSMHALFEALDTVV